MGMDRPGSSTPRQRAGRSLLSRSTTSRRAVRLRTHSIARSVSLVPRPESSTSHTSERGAHWDIRLPPSTEPRPLVAGRAALLLLARRSGSTTVLGRLTSTSWMGSHPPSSCTHTARGDSHLPFPWHDAALPRAEIFLQYAHRIQLSQTTHTIFTNRRKTMYGTIFRMWP